MIFSEKLDNAFVITRNLIKELGTKVTHVNLKKELTEHPDYPSLLSVSDTLNKLSIKNLVIKIESTQLGSVPTPCIAALQIEGGIFALVQSIKDGFVEWVHSEKGLKRETISDFSKHWQGVLLLAETTENSGEKNYIANRKSELLSYLKSVGLVALTLCVLVSGLLLTLNTTNVTIAFSILLLTKTVGLIVSFFLLWYILDSNHPFLENVCQNNKTTSCESVLQSKAATIGGIISWSEIGFFYFAGSFLALLLGSSQPNLLAIIGVINLLALPYTLFSVYYQAFVIKKWCTLCLAIQIVFWLEFLIFFFGIRDYKMAFYTEGATWITLIFSFGLPVTIWYMLKPILKENIEVPHLRQSLRQFQNNAAFFEHLLLEQDIMRSTEAISVLNIGRKTAKHTITLVTNPYCGACGQKHVLIKEMIEENSEVLKGEIVFANSKNPNDERNIFVRHLLSLDSSKQIQALDNWFEQSEPNFDIWKKHFPIEKETELAAEIAQKHNVWSAESDIQFTPTIFLNGYDLPKLYSVEDIKRLASVLFY